MDGPEPSKNEHRNAGDALPEIAAGLEPVRAAFVTDDSSLPQAAGSTPPPASAFAPEPAPEPASDPRGAERASPRPRSKIGSLVANFIDGLSILVVAGLVAASVAIAVAAEKLEPGLDLQLIGQRSAPPGARVALRAFLIEDDSETDAPRNLQRPVRLELLDFHGNVKAHGELTVSPVGNMEGILALPEEVDGRFKVRATVDDDTAPLMRASVQLRLVIDPEATGDLIVADRTLSAQQAFRAYAPDTPAGVQAPSEFTLRVVGGICVPEQPCELMVWVGEPAAVIRIAPSDDFTLDTPNLLPLEPVSGLVVFTITVKQVLRAVVRIEALRNGALFASREVQLPLSPGAVTLRVPRAVVTTAEPLMIQVLGARPGKGVIVDAFRDRSWERTGSVPAADVARGPFRLPFEDLTPGLWRIQVRTDMYGSATAASRIVLVRSVESRVLRLDELGDMLLPVDSWARALREGGLRIDPELAARFAFAHQETTIIEQPQGVSGYAQAISALGKKKDKLRLGALASFVLGGVFMMSLVFRRGLRASREARRVMAKAGMRKADRRRARLRNLLIITGATMAVGMAFIAGAMLVSLRSGLL